ncbi:Ig-like domain-containing protein, partial [Flavivirga aquimarina]
MKTSNNFLLKSKPILFFKSFVLKKEQLKYSYLLVFASVLFSFSAIAQPTFGGAQGPTLLSGTLNQQGSRYLYTDVVVNVNGTTSNADAVITIIELNNITVNSVDTVLGVDNRFEPTTTTTADGGYAEWEIVFVEDGTANAVTNGTPIEVDSYTLQAIDVDGNEFFEALVGDSFFLEAGTSPPTGTCPQGSGVTTNLIGCPTELVVSANGPFTRFQSGSDFASGVHVGRTEYIVSITYSNVSTVRFRNGRSTTGSSRLNSISFLGEVTFVTGTTDPDPTNDPPVVIDNLGHTVLENSGANGPYNVLTGSSDPDGNLDSTTVTLIDPSNASNLGYVGTDLVISGVGTYSVDNTGNVTFTPATNYSGNADVNFRVLDTSAESSNTATLGITVCPVANNTTDSSTICESDTKTLTTTSSGGTWSVFSGGGSILGTTYTPADITVSTSVTVRYTIPASAPCSVSTSDVTFTVNPLPSVPTVSTPVEYCVGDTASTLTATGTNLLWYTVSTGGTGSATAPTPSTATAGSTSYYVSQTDGNSCESARSEIVVTVNALPIAAAITGPNAVCMGSTIDLTEGTAGTIVWSSSNTGVATIDGSGVVTPVSAGTTDITYTVTDSSGCTSLSSATFEVTVNALPIAAAITGPNAVCMGSTIDLTEGTAGTIVWSSSDTGVATIDGSGVVTPVSAGTTDITYTVTDSSGCTSLSSATFEVTVNALPIAAAITGPNAVCMGSTIDLTEGTAG